MTPWKIKLLFNITALYRIFMVLGHLASFAESDSNFFPPLPANNNNSIQYLLYTPEHPNKVCFFEPDESNECKFDPSYETKILIHGYTVELLPGNFYEQIKNTLLETDKYNVIIVNWTKYNKIPYAFSVVRAFSVAINIGKMINFLVSERGVNPLDVHIIGHSLGAHVAGVAGKQVPNLGRITGLDPAGPAFTKTIRRNRLRDDSANFVDVMHTSNWLTGVGLGLGEAIGTIDFYPNGGNKQPACQMGDEYRNADGVAFTITSSLSMGSCYHNIALPYFMNSIDKCNYISVQCEDYERYSEGKCDSESNPTNRMGLYCVKIPGLPVQSKFYLNTTAEPPYCENE